MADTDPAAAAIARLDPLDLRPGGPAPADADPSRAVVVSGPDDLIELRRIVETALGVGTWPVTEVEAGQRHTSRLTLERPAAAVGLLIAMEGLIDYRSPWRKWRTAVGALAPVIADLGHLTLEAVVIETPGRPMRAGPPTRV